jgi:hypothetical protein
VRSIGPWWPVHVPLPRVPSGACANVCSIWSHRDIQVVSGSSALSAVFCAAWFGVSPAGGSLLGPELSSVAATVDMSSGVLAELSYDAAVRALDLQERSVEQLRARTGTLLAASSLTASFLGAQTIQHTDGLGTLGAIALVSLASSIGLCVYVLLPKSGFVFSVSAPKMYESLFDCRDDDEEVRRRLVYWLEDFRKDNQDKIDSLGRYYLGAAVALMLQLVFWSLALAATIS